MWEIILPKVAEKTKLKKKIKLRLEEWRETDLNSLVIPVEKIARAKPWILGFGTFLRVQVESITEYQISLESSLVHAKLWSSWIEVRLCFQSEVKRVKFIYNILSFFQQTFIKYPVYVTNNDSYWELTVE